MNAAAGWWILSSVTSSEPEAAVLHVAVRSHGDEGIIGQMDVTQQRLRVRFDLLDRDGNGRISVDEWVASIKDYYTSKRADVAASRLIGV